MNTLAFKHAALAAGLTVALVACSGATSSPLPGSGSPPEIKEKAALKRHVKPKLVSGDLYVANGLGNTVTTYVPGNDTPIQTIAWGISSPGALAFDSNNNLYVANDGNNTVTVYDGSAGSRTWVRTISQGIDFPYVVLFNPENGEIYVANAVGGNSGCLGGNGCGTVTIYSTSGAYLGEITEGIDEPLAMSIDAVGDVYVANAYSHYVHVYSPSTNQLLLTITNGVSDPTFPDAVAFDSSDNVYVGNWNTNSVTLYAHGSGNVSRTISQGLERPDSIALDSANNLYVGNDGSEYVGPYVNVYASGSGNVERKITNGIFDINVMTIGPFGYLFVGNLGPNKGNVTYYAPGTGNLQGTITTGINEPAAVEFGP